MIACTPLLLPDTNYFDCSDVYHSDCCVVLHGIHRELKGNILHIERKKATIDCLV